MKKEYNKKINERARRIVESKNPFDRIVLTNTGTIKERIDVLLKVKELKKAES